MKQWPEFDKNGDLPVGIHQGTLSEVLQHFGIRSVQRRFMGQRLERIYKLAYTTGQVARFIVFGSFVTAKVNPEDVDVFLSMEDTFDSKQVRGEVALIFDHLAGQTLEGAAYSGFDGRQRLTESRKQWNTGKSSETKPDVAS
jgi:hypothetical protein